MGDGGVGDESGEYSLSLLGEYGGVQFVRLRSEEILLGKILPAPRDAKLPYFCEISYT